MNETQRRHVAMARASAVALRVYAANAAEGKVPPLQPRKVRQIADQIAQGLDSVLSSGDES